MDNPKGCLVHYNMVNITTTLLECRIMMLGSFICIQLLVAFGVGNLHYSWHSNSLECDVYECNYLYIWFDYESIRISSIAKLLCLGYS